MEVEEDINIISCQSGIIRQDSYYIDIEKAELRIQNNNQIFIDRCKGYINIR